MTKRELKAFNQMLTALVVAEKRMSNHPDFNAWDLGPSPVLERVRKAIEFAHATPRASD